MILVWTNGDKEMLPFPLQVDSTVLCRAWTQMMMGVLCMPGALTGAGHTLTLGCTVQTLKRRIKVKVSLQMRCWEVGEHSCCWLLM